MKNYSFFFICILLFLSFVNSLFAQNVIFNTGKIQVGVGKYGSIRYWTTENSDTVLQIEKINMLVAGDSNQVLDYYNDIEIFAPTTLVSNPSKSDFEISGSYNNAYSGLPPNFLVQQNIYGWKNEKFCIVKWLITNKETSSLSTLAGLAIEQKVDQTYGNDHIYYDTSNQLLTQFDFHFVGIKILSELTTSAKVLNWFEGYSSDDKTTYAYLIKGTFDTSPLVTTGNGGVSFLAGQSSILPSEGYKTFYFAIAAGSNQTEMLTNIQKAITKYDGSSIAITSPIGGEIWTAGSSHNITWVSTNVLNVKLEYTTNNVIFWTQIIDSIPGSSGYYNWTIPNTPSTQCRVRVRDASSLSLQDMSDSVFTIITSTNISENNSILTKYKLSQNYPNPFNPTTKISYSLPKSSLVQLKIYNLLGQEITTLVNEEKAAGNYEVNYDAINLPSGVYFYKIQAGSFIETKEMILLK